MSPTYLEDEVEEEVGREEEGGVSQQVGQLVLEGGGSTGTESEIELVD